MTAADDDLVAVGTRVRDQQVAVPREHLVAGDALVVGDAVERAAAVAVRVEVALREPTVDDRLEVDAVVADDLDELVGGEVSVDVEPGDDAVVLLVDRE